MHKVVLGLLAVAAVILAVSMRSGGAAWGSGADQSSLVGKAAPEIALQTLDGKTVRLSEQKGKVVLLDMWATWCPPCRRSLPHVQALGADPTKAAQGLVVWAVNAQEPANTVQEFVTKNQYTFTVPLDAQGKVLKAYGVDGIPTTVLVGRDGKVREVFVGIDDKTTQGMDTAVDKALAEK